MNNDWKIFKNALTLGFNTTKKVGNILGSNLKKMIDSKNYRQSINYAKTLIEPTRTTVVIEIVRAWKKKPEFKFTYDIIGAVNLISEPQRTKELTGLMSFFAINKVPSAVKHISSLL